MLCAEEQPPKFDDDKKECLENVDDDEFLEKQACHQLREVLQVADCAASESSTSAFDVSDSELLSQKQRKKCSLDYVNDYAHEPEMPRSSPPRPAAHHSSIVRAVEAFPLPPGAQNRPVTGPPSLTDTLRRMELLQTPLPQDDSQWVAR